MALWLIQLLSKVNWERFPRRHVKSGFGAEHLSMLTMSEYVELFHHALPQIHVMASVKVGGAL
jgi:hypothetical protein